MEPPFPEDLYTSSPYQGCPQPLVIAFYLLLEPSKTVFHKEYFTGNMRPILVLAVLLPCLGAKPTANQRDVISPVQARDALCGNNGYDKNNPVSFYVSQDPSDVTSTGCSNLCRRAQGCASFAYGAGFCLLYTAPVVDNLIPSPSSPYVFNDLACIGSAGTSAALTSSPAVDVSPIPTTPGGSQACDATTVTVSGAQQAGVVTTVTVSASQLSGAAKTVTVPGITVTQILPGVQVTTTSTETPSVVTKLTTVTLSGSVSTLTLPGGTVTQTLPAVTATSTLTLPAVTKSATLTLPAVTSTLTFPAVTSRTTISATITNTATITIRCVGLGLICTTVT